MAVTGSLFAVASPASAAYACPAQQVCFYENYNREGSPATLAGLAQGGGGVRVFSDHKFHNGVNLNDKASSVHNNTNQWIRVYENTNYSGRGQYVEPGAWSNFTGGDVRNDKASSAQFVEEPCFPGQWC
ncbi:peptidase inhibitor family I36 protein [Paractinoplanes atraurantiacus]|nr:peptidase inhibitor family I36 protein [Actinoplanes atraurantiacus]